MTTQSAVTTRIARNIRVGDRIETTNGMREVMWVEMKRSSDGVVYGVDITVQCPTSDKGVVIKYGPMTRIVTRRTTEA